MTLAIREFSVRLPGVDTPDAYCLAVRQGRLPDGPKSQMTEYQLLQEVIEDLRHRERRQGLLVLSSLRLCQETAQRYPGLTLGEEPSSTVEAQARKDGFALHADLSLTGNPLAEALKTASQWLDEGLAEEVVLAGGGNAGALRLLLQASHVPLSDDKGGLSFGRQPGVAPASGSAAVVLSLFDQQDTHVQAILTGYSHQQRETNSLRPHVIPMFVQPKLVHQAFHAVGLDGRSLILLDSHASGFAPADSAELKAYAMLFTDPENPVCLASANALAGCDPCLSPVLALCQAVAVLRNPYYPPISDWSGPADSAAFSTFACHVPTQATPWFQPKSANARQYAIMRLGWDGSACAAVLREPARNSQRPISIAQSSPASRLVLIRGTDAQQLLLSAKKLLVLNDPREFASVSNASLIDYTNNPEVGGLTLAVIASNPEELQKELHASLHGVENAMSSGKVWQSPAGSCFNPQPLGSKAQIAFIYPGAFNTYPGLGRDLFWLFPSLWDATDRFTADLGQIAQERLLYPRGLLPVSEADLAKAEKQLTADAAAMIITGSLYAVLFTHILRDVFSLRPAHAFGYSLGEIGMLFANGIWGGADFASSRLRTSSLFQNQLTASHQIVRRAWRLTDPGTTVNWENHFVMAPVEAVRQALANEQRVYLTHVNTPRQCVIAGDAQSCARVISSLRCMSVRAPYDFALHCQVMREAQSELTRLLTLPFSPVQCGLKMYTALPCREMPMQSEAAAAAIAKMLCSPLDFSSLVQEVHSQGARVFLELGPNANCTRWIEENLKGKHIVAAAINRRGVCDWQSVLRLLARLAASRIPLNLEPLTEAADGR